jgi:hypothetical protein
MNATEQMWLTGQWRGALIAALAVGLVFYGGTVRADEAGDQGFAQSTTIFGDGLEDLRGGDADTTISIQNTQNLTASVEQVTISADSILTGAIDIGDHAFDNFSGLGVFNLVTGNNNAVNSAVEVTFTLE